jgi:hypothetical protein
VALSNLMVLPNLRSGAHLLPHIKGSPGCIKNPPRVTTKACGVSLGTVQRIAATLRAFGESAEQAAA